MGTAFSRIYEGETTLSRIYEGGQGLYAWCTGEPQGFRPVSNGTSRNVIVFGETGVGKSSVIKMLLETAPSTNSSQYRENPDLAYHQSTSTQSLRSSSTTTAPSDRATTEASVIDTYEVVEPRNEELPLPGALPKTETPIVVDGLLGGTTQNASYSAWNNGIRYTFWDTTGLNESSRGSVPAIAAVKHLLDLVQQVNGGINLLVYCIRASRYRDIWLDNYKLLKKIMCEDKVPLVMVITGLENEEDMEGWWHQSRELFMERGIKPKDVASVTAKKGEGNVYLGRYKQSGDRVWRIVIDHSGGRAWGVAPSDGNAWREHLWGRIAKEFPFYLGVLEQRATSSVVWEDPDRWVLKPDDLPVRFKIARSHNEQKLSQLAEALRETTREWHELSHANVLGFREIYQESSLVALVSAWPEQGNINDYLKQNPKAPRPELVSNVLSGLHYLHTNSIFHGNLTAESVLVKSDGTACLADFGLAFICHPDKLVRRSMSAIIIRNGRWHDPQFLLSLLDDFVDEYDGFNLDMYSVACVMYKILTGRVPFYELKTLFHVVLCRAVNRLPHREGHGLANDVWEIMRSCWSHPAEERPTIEEVIERFRWAEETSRSTHATTGQSLSPAPVVLGQGLIPW